MEELVRALRVRSSHDRALARPNGIRTCACVAGRTGGEENGTTSLDDQLLLLEHEPVYTIGRTPDRSSLSAQDRPRGDGSAHLPHPLFPINRGGQATYHGPGQLIGYPIIDLRRCGQDLHRYLRWIEQLLIGSSRRIRTLPRSDANR